MKVVEPDDDSTELFEGDWQEITPVYVASKKRTAPVPPPGPPIKREHVYLSELMLRRPPCVDFEADRIAPTTPPPTIENQSLAPLAASYPPPGLEDENPTALVPRHPKRGTLSLTLTATAVLGIVGLVHAEWPAPQVSLTSSSPLATAVGAQMPLTPLPHVIPDHPPILKTPVEDVHVTQNDVHEGRTEKLPTHKTTKLAPPPNQSPPIERAPTPETQPKSDRQQTDEDDLEGATKPEPEPEAEPEAEPEREAEPEPAPRPFDRSRAALMLNAAAAAAASSCSKPGGTVGSARVSVTFAPSGRVTTAVVQSGHLAGTGVGGCVARLFRKARVGPFDGGLVTVHKTVRIQ